MVDVSKMAAVADDNIEESKMEKDLYLSFDLSTQSLKVIVAKSSDMKIVYQDTINFDIELSEFKTEHGVHRHPDGVTITSPTLMWVKSIDILLMKMLQSDDVNLADVSMISGTAQQHGSVFWQTSAEMTLSHLNPDCSLADQLQGCFVVTDSPVWMDSSTDEQCKLLEDAVGGSSNLAQITGSKAYERFTGSQIMKLYESNRYGYANCERISLVSSFLASIMIARIAPIDYSDASGMNLLDIRKKVWNEKLSEACAPNLSERLRDAVPTSHQIGNVSSYLCERYHFSPTCRVVAFTGDNPASLIGMRLTENDVAVSLGTSDTLLFWTNEASASVSGHVFVNPVDPNEYMSMLCFKNGSLPRENICRKLYNGCWDTFNNALQTTLAGNYGNIGIYFDEIEILPQVKGTFRWNANDLIVTSFKDEIECRAVIEGQFLAKKYHAIKFGFKPTTSSKILATGGASNNKFILQILSNIMNCSVYTLKETSNSACLGGIYNSYLSSHSTSTNQKQVYYDFINTLPSYELMCQPDENAVKVYDIMLERYGKLETSLVSLL